MSAPEAFLERIPVDDMFVHLVDLLLDGPCIFLVLCNRKRFFVELLPPNYDPAIHEHNFSYDIMHGFNPGPRYPPVPGPLPGYDPPNSIELMYLKQLYEKMYPTEGFRLDRAGNQVVNKIHNLILTIGGATIRELAGCGKEQTLRETLENALNPETILLQMVTIDEEAKLIRRDDFVYPTRQFEPEDVSGVHLELPLFHPSQIEILETITQGRTYKVMVGGAVRFCKVANSVFHPNSRDIKVLQQIRDADLDPLSIRVPHLEGLVSMGGKEKVIGFLATYVEKQSILDDFVPPGPGVGMVTIPTREKWVNQIEHGIRLLHNAGVVWGDVHPPNIIIDKNNDVWLTGFGGGYHPPYVSLEQRETKEGDLEGLKMIRKHLGL